MATRRNITVTLGRAEIDIVGHDRPVECMNVSGSINLFVPKNWTADNPKNCKVTPAPTNGLQEMIVIQF